jgi:uncharacterized membrane protein
MRMLRVPGVLNVAAMMDWNSHMSTGGWIFSILMMVVVLALLVAAVVWIARDLGSRGYGGSTAPSTRDVLDVRLANGEIEPEQYERLRSILEAQPARMSESPPRQSSSHG